MLFILVAPRLYTLASMLTVVGVACLGSSVVLLNSFLPLFVAHHPSLEEPAESGVARGSHDVPEASGLEDGADHSRLTQRKLLNERHSSEIQLSTNISSKGVGLGYCAAVSIQCLSVVILYSLSKTSLSERSPSMPLRIVLLMVGICWACGTIPAALWLRERPGPPLGSQAGRYLGLFNSWFTTMSFAWKSLWKTLKMAAKLREARIFLLAWFLLSDAVATVSGTAILFARTELKMGTVAIALLSVTATSSGIVGAFSWPRLSKRYSLGTIHTIIICVLLMEIIPIYGLLGFLPFIKAWGVGGLQKSWEIYPLAFVHGFVMGGLSSYCRSAFGLLIPPGHEAAFFALFAITDKGSSAIGPAIVGAIIDATGSGRPAFGFLLVLIALPVPLIWMVDARQGQKDAVAMLGKTQEPTTEAYGLENRGDQLEESEGLLNQHE